MKYARKLREKQISEVRIYDVDTGTDELVFRSTELLLEAPNWHREDFLVLNGDGVLWRLDLTQLSLAQLRVSGLPELNNDHVLAPDHEDIYLSACEPFLIYRASVKGGEAIQITSHENPGLHFLHGVSPDGRELAYVCLDDKAPDPFSSGRIHLFDLATRTNRVLVNGSGPEDGSEYSLDGNWIYFNSEHFSRKPGHAQIARVKRDGAEFTQLTFDERVNWFPHASSCGRYWVYLSYPEGTVGHPADLPVELRLVEGDNWSEAKTVVSLHGGQGTINVNSWSPHRSKFAYVSYPSE